jgi:chromatin structure-remodeling complex protein RSC7
MSDGRWVEDDYYEEKVIAEIAEKGLKPGDPVGELPDPQMYTNEAATLSTAQTKTDRGGGQSLGIYRAGGPTTIFGQSGFGPYSDGPLNAVRKSFLNRDGLNEENWMFVAAQRTAEAGEAWGKTRREALKAGGGLSEDGSGKRKEKGDLEGNAASPKRESEGELAGGKKRRKVRYEEDGLPFGVYEPHSDTVLCVFFLSISELAR